MVSKVRCLVLVLLPAVGLMVAGATHDPPRSQFTYFNGRRLSQSPAAAPGKTQRAVKPKNSTTTPSNSTGTTGRDNLLCQWNPEDLTCTPTQAAWLTAGPGMPSSHYRRAVMMASARARHCSQYMTAAACAKDWQMRCYWQGSPNATNAACGSSDMEEMLLFSAKGFIPEVAVIPHGLTCPGSPARTFFGCYAFTGSLDDCRAIPHCMVLADFGAIKNVCVPKAWQQKRLKELRELFSGVDSLSTAAFGSCGAACWLQQAKRCSNSTTKKECTALPYCTYDEEAARKASTSILVSMWEEEQGNGGANRGGGTARAKADLGAASGSSRTASAAAIKVKACRHQTREFNPRNAVDQAAEKVYKQCSSATSQEACESASKSKANGAAPASASRAVMVDWRKYEPTNTSVQCSAAG